jgi:hypothetical protein
MRDITLVSSLLGRPRGLLQLRKPSLLMVSIRLHELHCTFMSWHLYSSIVLWKLLQTNFSFPQLLIWKSELRRHPFSAASGHWSFVWSFTFWSTAFHDAQSSFILKWDTSAHSYPSGFYVAFHLKRWCYMLLPKSKIFQLFKKRTENLHGILESAAIVSSKNASDCFSFSMLEDFGTSDLSVFLLSWIYSIAEGAFLFL